MMKKPFAVASGNYHTTQAAAKILRNGGNAYDAVLAALFMSFVSEPLLSSPGGGGYLLAHPSGKKARILDFFAQTPYNKDHNHKDFYPIHGDFGETKQEFHIGLAAAATPGIPAGIFSIHRKYASMPLSKLAQDAILKAESGLLVNHHYASIIQILSPILSASEQVRSVFSNSQGQFLQNGDIQTNPQLASFLRNLVANDKDWFYTGSPKQNIITDMQMHDGILSSRDFENYNVIERKPLHDKVNGWTIITNQSPTTGGYLIIEQLKHALKNTAKANQNQIIEAMMYADALKNSGNIHQYSKGTTHISAIDSQGNIASLTVSNGEGCGYMVPGCGFMLNNFLGEEDINSAGFFKFAENSRMASMMSPTILENGELKIALGSGGSNRIKTALFQVIYHLIAENKTLNQSVNSPRLHFENGILDVEKGALDNIAELSGYQFDKINYWKSRSLYFGGVNAVQTGSTCSATGDSRRKGSAVTGF